MKFYLTALLFLSFFLFPSKNVQRKIISDSEFNYTFYVSTEDIAAKKGPRYYYWYKAGEIHSSQGGSAGDLLHGDFTKSYKDNNLAEQGSFKKGLKDNLWKKWYKNGQLYEIASWKSGLRTGQYLQFSEAGQVMISGRFKKDMKHGIWINGTTNDTVFFKKGVEIDKPKRYNRKPLTKRITGFFKELFRKKEKNDPSKKQKADKKGLKAKKQPKNKKSKKQKKVKEQQ
ncbi:hypothetical protein FK220_006610 [Flavobacteriaceae bacterium TP-CH-4]|uniref:MORN repeat protein n=1 Tax=Pelagihabitans pacificus TaxID=2696054 RepID=A0A967ARL2_9FLAO|nr:hypothetical protein [Pelagihabitans pacificus]NHF59003.1 hypothetical protein [Pelagihabitans pacificus]